MYHTQRRQRDIVVDLYLPLTCLTLSPPYRVHYVTPPVCRLQSWCWQVSWLILGCLSVVHELAPHTSRSCWLHNKKSLELDGVARHCINRDLQMTRVCHPCISAKPAMTRPSFAQWILNAFLRALEASLVDVERIDLWMKHKKGFNYIVCSSPYVQHSSRVCNPIPSVRALVFLSTHLISSFASQPVDFSVQSLAREFTIYKLTTIIILPTSMLVLFFIAYLFSFQQARLQLVVLQCSFSIMYQRELIKKNLIVQNCVSCKTAQERFFFFLHRHEPSSRHTP